MARVKQCFTCNTEDETYNLLRTCFIVCNYSDESYGNTNCPGFKNFTCLKIHGVYRGNPMNTKRGSLCTRGTCYRKYQVSVWELSNLWLLKPFKIGNDNGKLTRVSSVTGKSL